MPATVFTIMDDYEVERIDSDNPAQSTPAAQLVSPSRQRPNGYLKSTTKHSEDSQKAETQDAKLTKYDV